MRRALIGPTTHRPDVPLGIAGQQSNFWRAPPFGTVWTLPVTFVAVPALAVALGCGTPLGAQRKPPQPPAPAPGKASWPTDGYDNARSSWQRHETLISPTSVKGMKLVWKLKLDNPSRQLHNLFPPMIVSDVRTTAGPKQIGVVAGVSDNLYGIDLEAKAVAGVVTRGQSLEELAHVR